MLLKSDSLGEALDHVQALERALTEATGRGLDEHSHEVRLARALVLELTDLLSALGGQETRRMLT